MDYSGAADPVDELRSGRTTDDTPPPGARQFPCRNCGGPLLFMPGTTHLKCPYCGTENDIPLDAQDDSYLTKHDFAEALERENRVQEQSTDAPTAEAVPCDNCGAVTTISLKRTSDLCPYCGSPLAMQNHFPLRLNVQAVLPFAIDSEAARRSYRQWLRSRWFAPNDFVKRATREEALKGMYMPFWTYDAHVTAYYVGQRGQAQYTTRMVPAQRNGRLVNEPQQVQTMHWTRASGNVRVNFDDILVPASHSLPGYLQDELQPWKLQNLRPFRDEFLAGFITESYQIPLKEGFEDAKRRMDPAIDAAIRRQIGGDAQRIDSKRCEYSNITFKHVLLPVWISAYAYNGETYRFMVNAQTGAITGDRPWSPWKIGLAVAAGVVVFAWLVYYFQ